MSEMTMRPSKRKLRGGSVRFYPSHLTKGLVALVVSLAFEFYAVREFSMVGKDVFPPVPPS